MAERNTRESVCRDADGKNVRAGDLVMLPSVCKVLYALSGERSLELLVVEANGIPIVFPARLATLCTEDMFRTEKVS